MRRALSGPFTPERPDVSGAFHEDPVFAVKSEEAEAFNRTFPHKEPASMIPFDVLTHKLDPAARKAEMGVRIPAVTPIQVKDGA